MSETMILAQRPGNFVVPTIENGKKNCIRVCFDFLFRPFKKRGDNLFVFCSFFNFVLFFVFHAKSGTTKRHQTGLSKINPFSRVSKT